MKNSQENTPKKALFYWKIPLTEAKPVVIIFECARKMRAQKNDKDSNHILTGGE
jgi:hypothetical protein